MKQIKLFFLGVAIFVLFYGIALINVTLLREPKYLQFSELWVSDIYKIKDFINVQSHTKPRILFFGGSSTLFGFNGELIDSQTPFTPINYGTHAGLPLNFHVDKIMQVAREYDTILLPLEFGYYYANIPNNDDWYIHNMIAWGGDYRKYISNSNIIRAYFQNTPVSIFHRWFKGINAKQEDIIESMQEIWKNGQHAFNYGYQSLSKYGDYCTQEGVIKEFITSDYLGEHSKISSFFIDEYNRLVAFAQSKNIKIFLIYPPTMENPNFSLNDLKTFRKIENLKAELKKHNIEIYGDFRDFHFEQQYFFNSAYHLNSEGAALRTQAFIKLLKQMQKDGLLGTH